VTANRFFLSEPPGARSLIRVEGEEHHHLSRVARVRKGDAVELFDGRGGVYQAVVASSGRGGTVVRILSRQGAFIPRSSLTLAMSLLKPPVLESVIRGAVELAVSVLVFIAAERSVVKSSALSEARLGRWSRIAREAAKQCKTGAVPEIRPPRTLADFLREDVSEVKIFLSERGGEPLGDIVTGGRGGEAGTPASASMLVGPEGGWSAREERLMREAGHRPASLGRSLLRAETAALCGLSLLSHYWVM